MAGRELFLRKLRPAISDEQRDVWRADTLNSV
jgi:hypothetical protein